MEDEGNAARAVVGLCTCGGPIEPMETVFPNEVEPGGSLMEGEGCVAQAQCRDCGQHYFLDVVPAQTYDATDVVGGGGTSV